MKKKAISRLARAARVVTIESLENRQLLSAAATASSSLLVFSDIRSASAGGSGTSPARVVTINSTGDQALTINQVRVVDDPGSGAANAARFAVSGAPAAGMQLQPGQSASFSVTYAATVAGLQNAILEVVTDSPTGAIQIPLHGIGTSGVDGANEPSLARILRAYNIPTIVGDGPNDNDAGDTDYAVPPDASSEEIVAQRFTKAGNGPVSIETLAVYSPGTEPSARIGYYTAGETLTRRELYSVSAAQAQTVHVTPNGATSFDPGAAMFGIYGQAIISGQQRTVYSEDAFNTFDATTQRHIRFFPLRNADGSTVANAYVFGSEDFTGQYDYNDVVGIIRNVTPVATGPVIGIENRDAVPFNDRFVFNRIEEPNPLVNDIVNDTATLRIHNTGDQPLVISSLVLSDTENWQLVNPPAAGTQVAARSFVDVTIKFIATTNPPHTDNQTNNTATQNGLPSVQAGGVWEGTLTVNTNDATRPSRSVTLAGYWQSSSERETEPGVMTIVNRLFGYTTVLADEARVQLNNNSSTPVYYGEEVVSSFWRMSDSTRAVTVRQLAGWHGQLVSGTTNQYSTPQIGWYAQNTTSTNWLFKNNAREGQAVLPGISGVNGAAVKTSFTTSSAFGWNIDNEFSDPARNKAKGGGYATKSGHAIRFYPVRDQQGNIVANQYLVLMDYENPQFDNDDHQDTVYLVSNIRPEGVASSPGTVIATGGDGQVTVQWQAVSGATGYKVYRATSATGTYTALTNSEITDTSFVDTTASGDDTYYYKVTAVGSGLSESVGTTVSASTTTEEPPPPPPEEPPATPSSLSANNSNVGAIVLTWSGSTGATGYRIERQASGEAGFTEIASGVTSTSYSDSSVVGGTSYTYRVRAENTYGLSDYSPTASAIALTPTTEPPPTVDAVMGTLWGPALKVRKQPLTTDNPDAVYAFNLSDRSRLRLTLNGLKDNADLELLDTQGNIYVVGNQQGRTRERIEVDLDAGTYLARVKLADPAAPTPFNLTAKAKPYKLTRTILPTSPTHTYSLDVKNGSMIRMIMNRLSANADLDLLDSNGNVVVSSERTRRGAEKINTWLDAGSYTVRVRLVDTVESTYVLWLRGDAVLKATST